MKITYIHQHFSLPFEPGGQRPWEFARRLASAGHEVRVLCGGQNDEDIYTEGVHIRRISAAYRNSMSTTQRIKSFISFMVKATVLAARNESDLVFASSTPLTTAIPGLVASFVRQAPFVFEVRDLWPSVPVELGLLKNKAVILAAQLLEKATYNAADHIIALSPGMAAGVKKVNSKVGVTVVPNASDVVDFESSRAMRHAIRADYGWSEDEIVLVYAGSFGATYDTPWLLEVAHHLQDLDTQYRVLICGEGADSERLRAMAVRFNLDASKLLPGALPKNEIKRLLVAADFAVSTMIDEPPLHVNSLNKVFDALAAGTPVIFNHPGWLPGLLEENGAGVRLSKTPRKAAEELHTLIGSGYDREELSEAALSLGQTQFDRDELFSRFEGILKTTFDNSKRGRARSRNFVPDSRSSKSSHLPPHGGSL